MAVNEPRAWDRSMVDRIRAGDDCALAAVYDRYSAVVHRIAAQCLGADRANDVTQDVFVHLWRHPDAYHPDQGGLRAYLAVIARRRAIDTVRSLQRREARERRASRAECRRDDSVEDDALAAVSAERVHAAVLRLPAAQRTAIELAYFGGMSFRDVAKATHTAEGTTKSRLRLGLGRLARELAGQLDGEGGEPWN